MKAIPKGKTIMTAINGDKYFLDGTKKVIVETSDPNNRKIRINKLTGQKFMRVGGKKRILK